MGKAGECKAWGQRFGRHRPNYKGPVCLPIRQGDDMLVLEGPAVTVHQGATLESASTARILGDSQAYGSPRYERP